jgi:hypothetical protein
VAESTGRAGAVPADDGGRQRGRDRIAPSDRFPGVQGGASNVLGSVPLSRAIVCRNENTAQGTEQGRHMKTPICPAPPPPRTPLETVHAGGQICELRPLSRKQSTETLALGSPSDRVDSAIDAASGNAAQPWARTSGAPWIA